MKINVGDLVTIKGTKISRIVLAVWDDNTCLLGANKEEAKYNFSIEQLGNISYLRTSNCLEDFKLLKYNQDMIVEREIEKFELEHNDSEQYIKNLCYYGIINNSCIKS